MALGPHGLTTADGRALIDFLADRIAEVPTAPVEPLVTGLNAQLGLYAALLRYRDHGALDVRDAGFIDGVGLALRQAAVRWSGHPDFQEHWAPPRVPVEELFVHGPRYRDTAAPR
ncbi:hypothetical protein E2C00_00845 [Streptomyces sp. WAC05374]|uniref:hypothetical protein n=1 Tax=Streptomyces sp. WAC05374 TaxID=2487420 RepID=UPI000F863370|nr:hypothetical protein [Streptomyces sp. WAC05374]RST19563.1 hypothetical protein EF905_00100 [Streptomyces sp. WAC05374]TDF50100.1 hypothetical protein E2B92_00820 [Streptomyces sp. WAC05374]TDF57826.1 hypothetical protein E2C02_08610 [Streptomyces sp. WAC05374]TDF60354.1 hypothetical protein E2C00_00845 [Streptomyces sp. WAC05374]